MNWFNCIPTFAFVVMLHYFRFVFFLISSTFPYYSLQMNTKKVFVLYQLVLFCIVFVFKSTLFIYYGQTIFSLHSHFWFIYKWYKMVLFARLLVLALPQIRSVFNHLLANTMPFLSFQPCFFLTFHQFVYVNLTKKMTNKYSFIH